MSPPFFRLCSGLVLESFSNKFGSFSFPACRALYYRLIVLICSASAVFSIWARLIPFSATSRLLFVSIQLDNSSFRSAVSALQLENSSACHDNITQRGLKKGEDKVIEHCRTVQHWQCSGLTKAWRRVAGAGSQRNTMCGASTQCTTSLPRTNWSLRGEG